jgi:multidrug efflux pump subunit AcrB
MDVVTAISQQNIQVAAGQIGQRPTPQGQQFQLTITTQGRLVDPEQFANIIIKTSQDTISTGDTSAGSSGQTSSTTDSSTTTGSSSTGAMVGNSLSTSTVIVRLSDVVTRAPSVYRLRESDLDDLRKRGVPPAVLSKLAVLKGSDYSDEQFKAQLSKLLDPAEVEQYQDRIMSKTMSPGTPRVERGAQQYDQSCTLDGSPSVALTIYQLPGSNAINTAEGVYAKMKDLKTRFPEGLDYKIVYDTTPFIRESVSEVFYTLRDAIILVAIVVLLFLQDWRAMILPMIDVPVSLIGTFAVMSLMGFTLNNLTLFGLVLAIGIVVDDAIVVLENIERQMASGLDARTATVKAMDEITGPVLAITLVLSAVFIPCCFLSGITGQFFRQFAVTIAVSTIISAINALTMTPSRAVLIFKADDKNPGHKHNKEALPWWIFAFAGGTAAYMLLPELLGGRFGLPPAPTASDTGSKDWIAESVNLGLYFLPGMILGGVLGRLIIRPVNAGLGWLFRGFNRVFDRVTAIYGMIVGRTLRLSVVVLIVYAGLLAVTAWQFKRTPAGFIPQQDKGYLILNVQMPDSASVDRIERSMNRIGRICLGDGFMTTAQGLQNLQTEGVPQELVSKLAPLQDKMYTTRSLFLKELAAALSPDELHRYQGTLLQHAALGPGFMVTAQSMQDLQDDSVAPTVVSKLQSLRDKRFLTKNLFLKGLAGVLSSDELRRYKDKLLQHSVVGGAYVITGPSLDELRADGVPPVVVAKLEPLRDKRYPSRNAYVEGLASVLSVDELSLFKDKLLQLTARQEGIEGISHTVGISGQSLILNAKAPNLGSMYVMLDEFDSRHSPNLTADAIAAEIQERCLQEVRGATVKAFGAPPVDGLGTTGGFTLIVEGRGSVPLEQLEQVSNKIVAEARETSDTTPGLQNLFTSSGANTPWVYLDIDRDKCQALGVQVSDVFNTLQVYVGSYYVNNFNEFGRTWQVNVQADQSFRAQESDILQLQVRNKQNQMVRLGTIMDMHNTSGPVMVMRYNLYNASAITSNPAPGTGSAQAIALMQEIANRNLQQSMQAEWTELAYLQIQAGDTAMWFFILAVLFVFLVLAAQYESWKLPLAVILVVPMCLLCSIIGVQIGNIEVSIFTQIGFVVLVGLACKNAILIVEFAKQLRETGLPLREATLEATRLRLRPIVMTSFAFIFGVVPLVFARGAGAEMRHSLGLAVFSGMLGVTLFGIFLTPVFFYVIQWFSRHSVPTGASTEPTNGHTGAEHPNGN